jgi:hypothetical protein
MGHALCAVSWPAAADAACSAAAIWLSLSRSITINDELTPSSERFARSISLLRLFSVSTTEPSRFRSAAVFLRMSHQSNLFLLCTESRHRCLIGRQKRPGQRITAAETLRNLTKLWETLQGSPKSGEKFRILLLHCSKCDGEGKSNATIPLWHHLTRIFFRLFASPR